MTVPRSFTHWTRLEPRPRNEAMTDALRAQIRDPLWLLSRQWQLMEFHGDDAGSPVRSDVNVEHDPLLHYDLGPQSRGDDGGDPRSYAGEPLEALVEREPVLSGEDGPPARLAAEAGLYFLRLLSAHGYRGADGPYAAVDFPDDFVLTGVDGVHDADGRDFERVMANRVLDGQAVYDAVAAAVSNIAAVAEGASPTVSDAAALPLPTDGERTEAFDSAIAEFVRYYRSLFDEPTPETASAFRPERMEYEFAVSTGEGDTETVFTAPGFDGSRLDWHAFSVDPDRSLGIDSDDGGGVERDDGEDGGTAETTLQTLPTRATFPGMPATRWWEFEDNAVTLGDIAAGGASLPRLLLLEFAVQYGNDWFLIPVETPVGALSRVTSLSITDSFGCSQSIGPTATRTDKWNAFTFQNIPNADEPGLFLPPTLPTSIDSDPFERVVLARDELANLAWGIEQLVEGPIGDPIDRDVFEPPSIRIVAVSPARDDDVTTEFVDFENPGDDEQDLSGLTVRRVKDGEETTVFSFDDVVLEPKNTLRLYTGNPESAPAGDGRRTYYCNRSTPIWTEADALCVTDEPGDAPRVVALKRLQRPSDAFADYRISTVIPDYWFPFRVDPTTTTDYRLECARLLDAEMLSTDAKYLPEPRGEILDPGPALLEADADTLRLYEEEVTSGGTEVTRRYQLSAWHTGRAHLWSGRRVRAGHSESSSDLRFDVLEERTDHGATAGGGLASDAGPPLSGSKDGLGSTDTSDGNDMDDE